jgi:quercetin dioxygenase-like cupin family protein
VEHLVITDGRLLTGPIGEEVEVAAGDYVSFPSDRPHVYEALGGQARALLLLSFDRPPTRQQEMRRELDHVLSAGDTAADRSSGRGRVPRRN